MDALLIAARLPRLAERTVRNAIVASIARKGLTPRAMVDGALLHFERGIAHVAADGVRPALLFAERDRIVRDLRVYLESKLAVRLAALPKRDIVACGRDASPFDAIVRGRRGGTYGLVIRRLGDGDRRFRVLSAIKRSLSGTRHGKLHGVVIYDAGAGATLHIKSGERYRTLAA